MHKPHKITVFSAMISHALHHHIQLVHSQFRLPPSLLTSNWSSQSSHLLSNSSHRFNFPTMKYNPHNDRCFNVLQLCLIFPILNAQSHSRIMDTCTSFSVSSPHCYKSIVVFVCHVNVCLPVSWECSYVPWYLPLMKYFHFCFFLWLMDQLISQLSVYLTLWTPYSISPNS